MKENGINQCYKLMALVISTYKFGNMEILMNNGIDLRGFHWQANLTQDTQGKAIISGHWWVLAVLLLQSHQS